MKSEVWTVLLLRAHRVVKALCIFYARDGSCVVWSASIMFGYWSFVLNSTGKQNFTLKETFSLSGDGKAVFIYFFCINFSQFLWNSILPQNAPNFMFSFTWISYCFFHNEYALKPPSHSIQPIFFLSSNTTFPLLLLSPRFDFSRPWAWPRRHREHGQRRPVFPVSPFPAETWLKSHSPKLFLA